MIVQFLFDVQDFMVEFNICCGIVKVVQYVNISVVKGEMFVIVGEFGFGKLVMFYVVMCIFDWVGWIAEGSVMFSGIDVKVVIEDQMRDLRGREVLMIFQNLCVVFNLICKVGDQIEDVLRIYVQQAPVADYGEKAIEALEQVKIVCLCECYYVYLFELLGGMCQCVVIVFALACNL